MSFSQVLLDEEGKESWMSTTTVLVPVKHKYKGSDDKMAEQSKPLTLLEEAKQDG